MGYVRVELGADHRQFELSENWSEDWTYGGEYRPTVNPLDALDRIVAKVKAAYEAGS